MTDRSCRGIDDSSMVQRMPVFLIFFLSKKGFLTWRMGKIRTLSFCFSFFQRQRCIGWFYHVHWFEEDSAMNYDGKGFLIWGRLKVGEDHLFLSGNMDCFLI